MPPVHPPIALKLSVVADLFGFMLGSQSLQHAGWWGLLGAGIGATAAQSARESRFRRGTDALCLFSC